MPGLLALRDRSRPSLSVIVPWNADEADDTDERGESARGFHGARRFLGLSVPSAHSALSVFHAVP